MADSFSLQELQSTSKPSGDSFGLSDLKTPASTSGTKAFAKSATENVVPSVAGLAAFTTGAEGGAMAAAPIAALTGPAAPLV